MNTLTALLLFSMALFFSSCSPDVPFDHTDKGEKIENFQEGIQAIFREVGTKISPLSTDTPQQIFQQAIQQVFPDQQDIFLSSFEQVAAQQGSLEKKAHTSDGFISFHRAETATQALELLDRKIFKAGVLVEDKLAAITLKETLLLLMQHEQYFSRHFAGVNPDMLTTKSACGWWGSWGKCAAGILGGVLAGGLAGCAAGAAIGAGVTVVTGPGVAAGALAGCKIGGAIGAVAGGLEGAAGNCDGCQN